MNKRLTRGFLVLAVVAQVLFAGQVPAADEPAKGHREVSGTIEKVESNLISVKTKEGTTRTFTINEGKREGLKSLKPGDQVMLEMDEGNQIVDIHPQGMTSSGKQHGHRSITGTVEQFSRSDMTMTIQTNDGKKEKFGIKGSAVPKVSALKEGTRITLEVDEQNRVMDVHPAKG